LGDVFLHILFYSRLASEEGKFDINDVVRALAEKLIHRHPHIYGNVEAHTEEQVKENWEKIKQKERTQKRAFFQGVPQSLPSLIKSTEYKKKPLQWD
jgi:uncharacterized protein YabN with tetrapyrrole methylase and pyrophosphatase domain